MADKKVKGAGDRFLPGSNIAKHREWRGLKDTWYDYVEWVKVLGIMGGFVAKSPVRIARGMLTYRWMGSYLGALNMIDRCVEGLRGPALRVARLYLNTIMKGSTTSIAEMMMGDRRFGDNAFGRTQVVLEQTMCPEILAGFQNLRPAQLEPFQGLLLCYMDQGANPYYIDAMESVGLPADSCRLSNNAAGVALLDEFPKIGACCISNNAPCDSSTMNSQLIERHLDVDTLPACANVTNSKSARGIYSIYITSRVAVRGKRYERSKLMDYLWAFLIGGLFCAIGQVLMDFTKLTPARILVAYVTGGVLLGALGLYKPLIDLAGCGATVPLTGFGYLLYNGVREQIDKIGFLGIFTGGLTASAAGITAAMTFAFIFSLFFKSSAKE